MWCIWKERNSRCFEEIERSMPDLKLLFLRTLFDWFSVWRNQHFSILDLLDFCNFRSWFVHPCMLPVYLGVSLFWYQWILITYQKKNIYIYQSLEPLKMRIMYLVDYYWAIEKNAYIKKIMRNKRIFQLK